MSDVLINADADRFTYMSEAHGTVSWIDHIVSTISAHEIIRNIEVLYNFVTSDHLPVCMEIALDLVHLDICQSSNSVSSIKWDALGDQDLTEFKENSDKLLAEVHINHALLLCNNIECSDPSHLSAINRLYNEIAESLLGASSSLMDNARKQQFSQVMGWNDICKEAHSQARDAFLLWVQSAKPRHGLICETMRRTRSQFKLLLRQCKMDNQTRIKDSLAKKLLSKDSKSFWKEIKKVNGSGRAPLASTVNGVSGNQNIANMWHTHYKELLNSSKNTASKPAVLRELESVSSDNFAYDLIFAPNDIQKAIKSLKKGKSAGKDGVASEHLIYSSERINVMLSLLFNCCVSHAYLPSNLLDTIIVPILKDNKGNITDIDNYHPIALTCIISKVLETVILNMYEDLLTTSSNQFGFKRGHSTDSCVFSLKQIVECYRIQSSPLYLGFLDASKAFDKINHWILLKKLIDRKVPILIVRLLYTWFNLQQFFIRWGNVLSHPFNVSNGVRQGGVLSSFLFNVYIDNLSCTLNDMKIGCNLNKVSFNNLMYADDLVLLAPSPYALQCLIRCCECYANDHEMSYNVKKSKLMCIKSRKFKDIHVPNILLYDKPLECVDSLKYLGVMLSNDVNDDLDIKRQIRGLYARGNMLVKCFKFCSTDTKVMLFKTFCTNMYCSQLWCQYTKRSLKALKVAYNSIFRYLMNLERATSISGAMISCNINCFSVILRQYDFKFKCRIETMDNTIVQALVNALHFYNSNLYKRWCKDLYILPIS
jgi:hypothetical protein